MPARKIALRRRSIARAGWRTAELRARRLVRVRAGGRCEAVVSAEVCLGRATNFHHRKPRSLGGEWSAANGLQVCGSGTTGCHGWITANPAGARAKGWSVSSYADPALVSVHYRGREVLLPESGEEP